ncbi:MAG TPA: hypothetical protein VGZ93_11725 [Candidatus Methylacidiphilales bacterium]|jgi:hypothetical protein|nr:hypothetical protein [Candidatus Methylacidiphilales bacterium]
MPTTNENSPTTSKRIVFVTGDKGGVGKSFTSRALVQYYLDTKQPFHAFDIDPVNPNLAQFYPDATTQIDIEEDGALDEIRNEVEKQPLLLVDCAARSLNELDHWFKDLGLIQERSQLHLSFTFVFVITPDKSCTVIMADTLEKFGKEAEYLVVKNHGKGKNFSIYEASKLRTSLLKEHQGQEITLPPLLERTVVYLDSHDIGFGDALNHPEVAVADRSRVRGFLEQSYAQFNTVKPLLLP